MEMEECDSDNEDIRAKLSIIVDKVLKTLVLNDLHCLSKFYQNILKTMLGKGCVSLMPAPSANALQSTQLTNDTLDSVAQRASLSTSTQPQTPIMCATGPLPPETTRLLEPPNEHNNNRNVLWTFEDIHMLIGTDLSIFGDKDRPCVSLRLKDSGEPINVLTGVDYWLDNLMCNVPEVLMCYHLDGIVQKYEPMMIEDLPNMENTRFSPTVIQNVAQNILSFLKSNSIKAGHTYWLFKDPQDYVVKLYDLTSLCPDSPENPFTTPVAMLLYRIARNMRLMNRTKHMKLLLEHVVELLKVERYPQVVASSHYMLSDLYVPNTINPGRPDFKDDTADSDDDSEFGNSCDDALCEKDASSCDKEDESDRTEVIDDCTEKDGKAKSEGVNTLGVDPPERCGQALQHALQALRALNHLTVQKSKVKNGEKSNKINPCDPINLEFDPLKHKEPKEQGSRRRRKRDKKLDKSTNSLMETKSSLEKDKKTLPTWDEPNRDDNVSWKLHLKTLLFEKICIAYATLAEHSYVHEEYGSSIKYISLVICQKSLSNMIMNSGELDAGCLVGRIGDNFFRLSKNWANMEKFIKQFETDHEIDCQIKTEIESNFEEDYQVVGEDFEPELTLPKSVTEALLASCEYYERAERAVRGGSHKRDELLRRQASVRNELAVRYMHDAQQMYAKYAEASEPVEASQLQEQYQALSRNSAKCLNEAAAIFRRVADAPNLALLYCNKARYMRFKAHCHQGEFGMEKRAQYSGRAEELYNRALKLLGPRESTGAASVRDLVCWELFCHLYTRAVFMQDCPGVYANDVTEVAEAFKHALKYCLLGPGPRQQQYQSRSARIYYRLGSLYASQYRMCTEESPRRRALLAATCNNYERAALQLAALEDAPMFLTVRLEHVAALEAHAAVSPDVKLKSLQMALILLRHSLCIMKVLKQRDPDEVKTPSHDEIEDKQLNSEHGLLCLFENKLHFILKTIIQYCRTKQFVKITDVYKKIYCASLKIKKDEDVRKFAASICDVLQTIEVINKEFDNA